MLRFLAILGVAIAIAGHASAAQKCVDQLGSCFRMKARCYSSDMAGFMKKFCRGTCDNYCSSGTRAPPTKGPPVKTTASPTKGPPVKPTGTNPTLPPGACGRSQVPHQRIISGRNAIRGSWPWMVSLQYTGYHTCGASLIAPNWILTAAHCTEHRYAKNFKVLIGEHDRAIKEGSEQTIQVKRVIDHPKYSNRRMKYDMSLMELESPVKLGKHAQVVCLPPKNYVPSIGTKCYLTGWGTMVHPGDSARILQQAILPVVEKKHCFDLSGFVCAGYGKGSRINACKGDSGGPFVCQEKDGRWVQQGVTSFVVEYCKYYTAFTRIADHMDWINSHVNK